MYIEIVRLVRMDRFSILSLSFVCFYKRTEKWPFDNYAPFPQVVFLPDGDAPVYHEYKVHLQLCLRTSRGHSSHSSEECMQGLWAPMFRLAERTLTLFLTLIYLWNPSYLSLLVNDCISKLHQVFFLHAFYTDYTDYCIGRFWCIIFNGIALWPVVTRVVFLSLSLFLTLYRIFSRRLFCVNIVNLR